MATNTPNPILITINDLSTMTGWPIATIRYRLTTDPNNFIPAAKIGKRIYFKMTDAEAWINAQFDPEGGGRDA